MMMFVCRSIINLEAGLGPLGVAEVRLVGLDIGHSELLAFQGFCLAREPQVLT